MNRDNYSGKKSLSGYVGLFCLSLAMPLALLAPQSATAGEAEATAAILLGTAIVVAAQDDRRGRHVEYVHYDDRAHRWRYRNGHRYCDSHHSFHLKTGHHHDHHRYTDHKHYRAYSKPHYHQYHYSSGHYHQRYAKSGRRGEVHYHSGGAHGRSVEKHRSHKPVHHHAEARWNTRVRAY